MLKILSKIFPKTTKTNIIDLQKNVLAYRNEVKNLTMEIELGKKFKDLYHDTMMELCSQLNLYVWKKDKDFLYTFVNINYCTNFLNIQPKQIDDIKGLSDSQVHQKFSPNNKDKEFWGKICFKTDTVVRDSHKECNFIEGDIDHIILNVKKIPIIDNGKFNGMIGIAQDCNRKTILSYLRKANNNIKLVYGSINERFCYQIIKQLNKNVLFSRIEES